VKHPGRPWGPIHPPIQCLSGRKADHVKSGVTPLLPPYAFMRWLMIILPSAV
jgi:hypothetical protein